MGIRSVTLLSVIAYSPEYRNWLEYIRDLDNISDNSFRSVFERADRKMYERKKELKALGADVRD